jgi:pyridinium-3,5-bisthiocarboxylic acid mononucleotide nickel chelatase
MKALYLDCISGISGDMTVGALVDLGVKPSTLEWELSKVGIGDFHMHFDRKKRQEIEGVKFSIHGGATHTADEDDEEEHADHGEQEHHHEHGHEHDEGGHEHPHEHEEEHHHHHAPHEHEHEHEHGTEKHGHEHGHAHDEHGHSHAEHHHGDEPIRTHRQIRELIEHSELSPYVKQHALGIFRRIAEAEAKIHGKTVDDVHFHEVGGLDSIADIVLTCVGFETLGVGSIFVSPLHDGRGTIHCAHGTFPLPAPATLEILRGIPLGQIDDPYELITPTGAAIVAEFGQGFGPMPTLKVERIGYGLGTRDLKSRPNVLRAVLGELAS